MGYVHEQIDEYTPGVCIDEYAPGVCIDEYTPGVCIDEYTPGVSAQQRHISLTLIFGVSSPLTSIWFHFMLAK